VRHPLLRHFAVAAACLATGTITLLVSTRREGFGAFTDRYAQWPWLDMWLRWDARWYEDIALNGYFFRMPEQSSVAFFPLYPLTLRGLSKLTGIGPLPLGVLVTAAFGCVASVLFVRWVRTVRPDSDGLWAHVTLLLWPFAFYLFGAVYADALFLSLILGAFICLERGKPEWAAALGALATATRPIAPAVVLGLLARSIELDRAKGPGLRPRAFVPALAATGFVAYLWFQYATFGTPFAFVETQAAWSQKPGWQQWLKIEFFSGPRVGQLWPEALLNAALAIAMLLLAVRVFRTVGKGYGIYVAVALGLPLLSSAEFIGLGRYSLAAFPSLLALSELLGERPKLRWAWLAASALLLLTMTARFAVGRYVS
jgi:hypothetical protein